LAIGGVLLILSTAAASADSFDLWLEDLRHQAAAEGVSPSALDAALQHLRPMPEVLEQEHRQPEFTMSFVQYLPKVVSQARIAEGRERMNQYAALLKRVGTAFGVQPRFIVALWAVESDYGKTEGNYPVVRALATLAYGSARKPLFRRELVDALRIVDSHDVEPFRMTGSWAGAMGQCQFMPSSFLRYAVDFDGDGRRDIWASHGDIFASIANYLASAQWRAGETWGRQVRLPPGFAPGFIGLDIDKTLLEWSRLGLRSADGSTLPSARLRASLVAPDGPKGPAYVVYANFKAIMRWNRSTFFATSVGLLADGLENR
jgi:membrane-bound lytic murein transglycosylase B